MAANGRWLCSVMGEAKFSCFPYSHKTVGAVSFTICFLSPHMLGSPLFSALHWYFPRNPSKYLSSAYALHMWYWSGDIIKPDLTSQYSSAQKVTQIFHYLFSSACYHSGCLAPMSSFRFLLLLLSYSDFSVCSWQNRNMLDMGLATFCWVQSQSEFRGKYWLVPSPDSVCSSVRII